MDALTINRRKRFEVVLNAPPQICLTKPKSHALKWFDTFLTRMIKGVTNENEITSIKDWLNHNIGNFSKGQLHFTYTTNDSRGFIFITKECAINWLAENISNNDYEWIGCYTFLVYKNAFKELPELLKLISPFFTDGDDSGSNDNGLVGQIITDGVMNYDGNSAKNVCVNNKDWDKLMANSLCNLYGTRKMIADDLAWEDNICVEEFVNGQAIYMYRVG